MRREETNGRTGEPTQHAVLEDEPVLVVPPRLVPSHRKRARSDSGALRTNSRQQRSERKERGGEKTHLFLSEESVEAEVTGGDVEESLEEDRSEEPARVLCKTLREKGQNRSTFGDGMDREKGNAPASTSSASPNPNTSANFSANFALLCTLSTVLLVASVRSVLALSAVSERSN
jgi:hypothetical protein